MDSVSIWAWAMTGVFIGVPLTLIFGIYWYLLERRAKLADSLQPIPGTLHGLSFRHVRGAKGSSYWTIDTSYNYAVQGQRYQGKRPSLDFNSFGSEAKARQAVAGLEPGPVTVWYDPAKPSWSSLGKARPHFIGTAKILALVSVAVSVVGGIVALMVG